MAVVQKRKIRWTITLLITICLFCFPAYAKYNGGSGIVEDPYLIYTAEQMNAIGAESNDWGKHFRLMADIDMSDFDGNDGRPVFNIIAPDADAVKLRFQGTPFTGVFDGNGHTISNFSYTSTDTSHIGLFGYVDTLGKEAVIKDLGLISPNVDAGAGGYVGSLVGVLKKGTITGCYVEGGNVVGYENVGGLVGAYGEGELGSVDLPFTISNCCSTSNVQGTSHVGGLVGSNYEGRITNSYATGNISGKECVGGLVGSNFGSIVSCYSSSSTNGEERVGGLVGVNRDGFAGIGGTTRHLEANVTNCCSMGTVSGYSSVGGLVGSNGYLIHIPISHGLTPEIPIPEIISICEEGRISNCYSTGKVFGDYPVGGLVGNNGWGLGTTTASFWDIETSGQTGSWGGAGKTIAEMQTASTYLEAGWDFVDETENGPNDVWMISEGLDYPRLWWEKYSGGTGDPNNPYRIATAEDLMLLGKSTEDYDKNFILTTDIDLHPHQPFGVFDRAVIAPDTNDMEDWFQGTPFTGVFDGNGHTILHLTVMGGSHLGLFGWLGSGAEVRALGVVDVNITGSGEYVGGLVGSNGHWDGEGGVLTNCYSSGSISGKNNVGGLVGFNYEGDVIQCYSTAAVGGDSNIGGLVGRNYSLVMGSYSTGLVRDTRTSVLLSDLSPCIGGLVGDELVSASIGHSANFSSRCIVADCFWNVQSSGQSTSAGGAGKTTAEMQTASTFLEAGWDFVGETANGTEDIWWILEGQDYPRLWWELIPEN